ncbi:MAG: cytochrome C [Verrucomicrobiae bacterium]|nr:cytochrome C [Verrucomicrobiae bacterium]
MPIYEFYSPDTNRIYSFYARSIAYAGKTPRCPDGPQYRMIKLISPFAVIGRAKEKPETQPADQDDARMEAAMQAMEREFAAIDTENPDPRQLGRMIRRMAELAGERMPPALEEMTRRMEAGEDPEKLEEEYGDALEEMEPPSSDETEATESEKRSRPKSLPRRPRKPPTRDPTLYDMADYV